ncbi:hypothetical protein KY348_05410 [Candidatus Woesearchaeota archaeon]|nr:hypothetical protein [Candidatus Woesearchaeota archaeon]
MEQKQKTKYQTLKDKLAAANIEKIIPTVFATAALTVGAFILGNYTATQKYKQLHENDYLMISIDDHPRELSVSPGRIELSFSVGGKRFRISDLERYDPLEETMEELKRRQSGIERGLYHDQKYNHRDKEGNLIDPKDLFYISFFINKRGHFINKDRHGETAMVGNLGDHVRILVEPLPVYIK